MSHWRRTEEEASIDAVGRWNVTLTASWAILLNLRPSCLQDYSPHTHNTYTRVLAVRFS
jgi:hypothetical protein